MSGCGSAAVAMAGAVGRRERRAPAQTAETKTKTCSILADQFGRRAGTIKLARKAWRSGWGGVCGVGEGAAEMIWWEGGLRD